LALQTTLLGLAIAIILALVAALVGPLLIDWGGYRSAFEAEASHLIGLEVRVTGTIDARLLPSPQLTLHDIEIGRRGANEVRARSLNIEFALGPLMRGEWRAAELRLVGPQLRIGLDASGHVQAPSLAVGFNPDALAIDRLNIQDGKLTLTDAANGASVTLDKLWVTGEARSLLGPFNGEGAATIGGDLYPFRIAAGRYGEDGKLKLHINVDPVSHPLSVEADGMLTLAGGKPDFDGSLNMTRPVAIASRSTGKLSQPWRVSGKLKVAAASALMPNFEFDYGSQNRGFKLTGVADFKFGKTPRFDGVLSGRQIDLDRALATGDDAQAAPAAAIGKLAQLAGGAFRPAIPIQIGIGIDQVTLGGDTVQNLRGDISTGAQAWNLDRFEFRAPGYTQVKLSGRLAVGDDRVAFTGPAEIKANNPQALAAWLEGRKQVAQGDLKPLSLRGQLTLANDRIAVERLNADFDRKSVTGRFAYFFAAGSRPARLDAALKAPNLDIDAALGFGNALLAGSHIERPHDMTIAADIGHAIIAGFEARDASARLKVDAEGLQIDRLSVADLGGAAFSASGRIVTAPPSPQGSMRLDLDAPDMTPVMALLARFAPAAAQALAGGAKAMAPAKLHATLTMEGASPTAQAKLAVDGSLGKTRLAFNGETNADLITFKAGDMHLAGKLTADDGKALVSMLGLDRVVAVAAGPGALTLDASGLLHGDWRVNGKLSAGGLEANASGTARLFADHPSADLRAAIMRADAAPLRGVGDGALPVAFSGRVALAGKDVSLSDIDATIAGTALRGKLGLTLSTPHRLQGEIEADHVDGAGLIAAAIGLPPPAGSKDAAWSWSSEPFGAGVFGDYAGQVKVKARRIDLLPQLTAREFSATLGLGKDEFSFDDMAGDIAGGRLSGRLSFRAAEDGLSAHAKLALNGVDATGLLGSSARPAVTGTLALSVETEGTGLSPVALFGSLRGSGKIMLADAQLAGLDPRAFDAVTRAVDQGLAIDAARISDVVSKTLESGRLSVERAEGTIAVSAGQARLSKFSADSRDAQLSLAGNLDLTDGSIDARLVLSGSSEQAGSRPDIFMALKGPVTAPARSIDVAALTGWLTLRAVENQAKQLREIERASPHPGAPPTPKNELPLKSELAPNNAPAPAPISSAGSPAPKSEAAALPRSELVLPPKRPPAAARKRDRAPALPAPVEIGPLPAPGGAR
jgi:large subunit ribosomal protein L24